ncbi:serine/threonine-protein phosphatase 4 regulatory subunit 2-like [Contarinia nasturtii]|uniref:serine/threonine-protein phosphatase 4 regulatory subunit 2-like n=1 Tax=Contarinia nasturtii TaxID=265458 RepID=UPI0012D480DE|nr:serine/threonine-protein phosphatase 4 regulatory subunit 2-like [Contarinia nasturtii]
MKVKKHHHGAKIVGNTARKKDIEWIWIKKVRPSHSYISSNSDEEDDTPIACLKRESDNRSKIHQSSTDDSSSENEKGNSEEFSFIDDLLDRNNDESNEYEEVPKEEFSITDDLLNRNNDESNERSDDNISVSDSLPEEAFDESHNEMQTEEEMWHQDESKLTDLVNKIETDEYEEATKEEFSITDDLLDRNHDESNESSKDDFDDAMSGANETVYDAIHYEMPTVEEIPDQNQSRLTNQIINIETNDDEVTSDSKSCVLIFC